MGDVDVLVLGGGSGGYSCALRAAQLGRSVAVIERGLLGGTCLHVGCIPTKALLHAAEVADQTREAARFGVCASFEGVDMAAVTSYCDGVVRRLFKGLVGLVQGRGVTVIAGTGRMTAAHEVTVTADDGSIRAWTADHVVLASGSRPRLLPGADVDGERVITSEHALRLQTVPASVVVLGGGVIGCELASVWRSFGAEVTVVEALPRMIAAEDAASSAALERAFANRGIRVLTGAPFQSLKHTDDGVAVTVDGGEVIQAELVLVAVGREPVSDGLGYAEQGVAMERGYVLADDHCRTNLPGVWAVGDLVPGPQLAHRGFAQGALVAEQIAGLDPVPVPDVGIPRVTYSHPEVASVGLTEAQALTEYGEGAVTTLTYDLGGNGKSQILRTQGFVKLVRRNDGPVLGVHLVGDRVGELVGEAQLIYNWEAHPEDVAGLIHAHPTQNEALGEAHLALAGTPLHAHA